MQTPRQLAPLQLFSTFSPLASLGNILRNTQRLAASILGPIRPTDQSNQGQANQSGKHTLLSILFYLVCKLQLERKNAACKVHYEESAARKQDDSDVDNINIDSPKKTLQPRST